MPGLGLKPLLVKANLVLGRLSMGGTQPLLASYNTLPYKLTSEPQNCYQEVASFYAGEGEP